MEVEYDVDDDDDEEPDAFELFIPPWACKRKRTTSIGYMVTPTQTDEVADANATWACDGFSLAGTLYRLRYSYNGICIMAPGAPAIPASMPL